MGISSNIKMGENGQNIPKHVINYLTHPISNKTCRTIQIKGPNENISRKWRKVFISQ